MARLIGLVARALGRQVALLALILAVLVAGAWVRAEWRELAAARAQLATRDALLAGLREDLARLDAEIAADSQRWRAQLASAAAPLRAELESLDQRVARGLPAWQSALRQLGDIERQAAGLRRAAQAARADYEARERAAWWWDRWIDPRAALELEQSRAKWQALERSARSWEAARDRLKPRLEASPMRALLERQTALQRGLADLDASESPRATALRAERERKALAVGQAEALVEAGRDSAARDPRERLLAAAWRQLPLALGILAAALLVPLAIRALFFFVLAPLAARRPAIRILPEAASVAPPLPLRGGVSLTVELAGDEELLVQPDCLQGSDPAARKRTRWLLDPSLPFASLASGMFALTALAPPGGGAGTRAVVSAGRDPFAEVALLELPRGAAMVLQPRGLVGVIHPVGAPPRITRHWRLASLHAWLTLQLRYLVFHGPCRLLLKGCRGVQATPAVAGEARLVSQDATLGFSANLDYRTTRSETFVAYALGREALLNDLFAGTPGCFVHEALPDRARRAGVTGRGLEGLADAVLKAFGI